MHTHQYFKLSELNEMYINISLRSFAIALFGIFIPAILYTNNYSVTSILLYYVVHAVVSFLGFIVAIELMRFIGIKHTMLISIPFFIFLLIQLYTIELIAWDYYYMAICHGLFSAFFWCSFHIEFATYMNTRKTGSQVSWINTLSQSFSIIGPLIGGLILSTSGSKALAITCGAIIIISGLPLLLTKDHNVKIPFKAEDLIHDFSAKRCITFLGEGMRSSAAIVMWPLFLAITGISFLAVGSLYTVTRFLTILTSIFMGKLSDRARPQKFLKFGTTMHSLTWLLRGFLETAASFTAVTSLGGLSFIVFNIPMQKIWYTNAKHMGPLFILRREFYLNSGRLLLLGLALIVLTLTQSPIYASISAFFLGAIATMALNFVE